MTGQNQCHIFLSIVYQFLYEVLNHETVPVNTITDAYG